jgi:hypothetical protein
VTGLRNGRQGVRISAEVRDLSLIQNIHTSLGLRKSAIQWVPWFFPRAKKPGRQVNSFPPTAEGKNEWRYTSTPPPALCLYGVVKHKFNFLYFKLSLCSESSILTFGWFPASEFYVLTFRNTLSVPLCAQEERTAYTAYEDGTDRMFQNIGRVKCSWVKCSEV